MSADVHAIVADWQRVEQHLCVLERYGFADVDQRFHYRRSCPQAMVRRG